MVSSAIVVVPVKSFKNPIIMLHSPFKYLKITAMNQQDILKAIKERISKTLIENGIDKYTIYLFGSRARGKAREGSDFDILITIDKEISGQDAFKIYSKALWSLRGLRNSFDIIIKSKKDFDEEKNISGALLNDIKKEVVVL
jgi:predicted nucleotidyltransferase